MRFTLATIVALSAIAFAAPAHAEPPTVPVTFLGRDPRIAYRLLVDGRSCVAPCALDLPPGPAHLLVAHPMGQMERDLELPPRPSRVTFDPANRANRFAGALGLALGSILVVSGIAFAASPAPTASQQDGWSAAGATLLVGGLLIVGVGAVALALLHGDRVRVE